MPPTEIPVVPRGLRADLVRIVDTRMPRRQTIVDAMSGRISRLRNVDWEALQTVGANQDLTDPLIGQLSAAGLLQNRAPTAIRQWRTFPMRALAFQVPLFSIDAIANKLAKRSAGLLSPFAILIWSLVILLAAASLVVGWSRAIQSIETLYMTADSNASIAGSIAIVFIVMKCLHELGHAVACRRLQVPVGDVGLFFFLGMPCPYCDVSQIWRVDSRLQRAAVMLAGVYVELIVASMATLLWWLAPSGALQLIAMNTMIVCGASAIVFNANPLMKLDGYYVLSDVLGTPNLRRQASLVWDSLVMTRLAGQRKGRSPYRLLTICLAGYHVASIANRVVVVGAISVFVMSILGEWNLWWVGFSLVAFFVTMSSIQTLRSGSMILRGRGVWNHSHWFRRLSVVLGSALTVVGVLCVPIRRDVKVAGWLDVQNAITLFVPESSWVERVDREYGDRVAEGDEIAKFRDDDLNIQLAGFKSRTAIAAIESEYLQRRALRGDSNDIAWQLDEATRELIQSQFKSLENRTERLRLTAPREGMILPVLNTTEDRDTSLMILRDRQNRFEQGQSKWCRIGDPTRRCVYLRLNTTDRQSITLDDPVKLIVNRDSANVIRAIVDSIDELPPNELPQPDGASFIIECRLPTTENAEIMYGPIGATVEGQVSIDRETVWAWLHRTLAEFVASPATESRSSI